MFYVSYLLTGYHTINFLYEANDARSLPFLYHPNECKASLCFWLGADALDDGEDV